jgi:hypothetical protein
LPHGGQKEYQKNQHAERRGKNRDLAAEGHIALVHRIADFFSVGSSVLLSLSSPSAISAQAQAASARRMGFTQRQLVKSGQPDRFLGDGAPGNRDFPGADTGFPRPDRIRSCAVAVRRLLKAPSRAGPWSAPRRAVVMMSPEMSLNSVTRLRCGMRMISSNRKIRGRTFSTADL